MNYCEKLKHYLDDCDENIDLIKEAIASLEGHFELIQENELLHFSRVDAIAYLALNGIVRCKDCIHGEQLFSDYVSCEISEENESGCHTSHKPDFYCADGIRKK